MSLAQGIQELLGRNEWRPPQCGGSTGKKLRRLVLDLCAWNRDFIYVFSGHTLHAVSFTHGDKKRKREPQFLDVYCSNDQDFRRAVSTANIQDKHAAVARYAALLQKDSGKAAKFLSSVFKPKNCFHIQLKDEVGNPMDVPDMISTLVDDLIQRANNDFPQDSGFEHSLALRTSCLRSRSFVLDASSVYTEDELLEVLCKLETSKKCIRGCFAAKSPAT